MNEIVNHKTISFCWPFGPRDSGPVGKAIIPHLRRYQGFAVERYSVTLDALYLGHPPLSLNRGKPYTPEKAERMPGTYGYAIGLRVIDAAVTVYREISDFNISPGWLHSG